MTSENQLNNVLGDGKQKKELKEIEGSEVVEQNQKDTESEISQNVVVQESVNSDKNEDCGVMVHKNQVSISLGRLIQICVKLLTQDEYRTFSRKVSKYLNSLPEESTKFGQLITYIDEQCALLKTDT